MDGTEITVRPASADDAEAAAAVYVSSAEHHRQLDADLYRVPDTAVVAARYRERIPQAGDESVLLVAEVDGFVVGSSLVRLLPPPSEASMLRARRGAEVDVAVVAGQRRRGVGRRLMAAAEQWAAERGARVLLLDCHADNRDAIRFYTGLLGYRQTGVLLSKLIDADPSEW